MAQSSDRIFVFLEVFAHEGGIQAYVQDILCAYLSLAPQGKTDIFLLRDRPDASHPLQSPLLTYHYCQSASGLQERLKLGLGLAQRLLQSRPAHVYCGHVNLAPLVRLLCQPFQIPYTVITYGADVWQPLSAARRQALQQAEAIWTISRYTRDRLCLAQDIPPSRVQILPCIVDGQHFVPGIKPPELVEKYHLGAARVLMTVGRLWSQSVCPSKGVEGVLRALPQILAVYPDVRYLIIGRGDDQPRLAQLAADLGISEQVIFAGFVPTADLVAHYQLADAYIMPSIEGFGIVYLEAMACGVPVLSGDADGSADPLQDGRLGWRASSQNPAAIAAACLEILQGADPRCRGEWLRSETLKFFGKDKLREILAELIYKQS